MKVRDLVSLPPVRTVVQLSDTRDASLRTRLVEQFVLTDEAGVGLKVILRQILRDEGGGFFLKGHYGSGKSHFLAYLSLILGETGFLRTFLARLDRHGTEDARTFEALADRRLTVLPLSLVEHRAGRHLEDIVAASLGETLPGLQAMIAVDWPQLLLPHAGKLNEYLAERNLGKREFWASEDEMETFAESLGLVPPRETRRAFFEQVFEILRRQESDGLVILVDELSEFLRAKPSIRRFNEDIRYLQFLGEFSKTRPLWMVAALQEHIEETGEIRQEVFNKIKDRYPVRLQLTAGHVKTLVGEFLIQKKPEAAETLADLHQKYVRAFPSWAVSREEFCDLYPLHPAAIELLEDLKPLFSKTRGFIDFIHYQVRGDATRGIEGILDESHETLLCPDRIFDHFQDRMQGMVETLPFLETVYAHYGREMKRIFEDPQDRRFAFRLLKLLILQQISPVGRRFTVRELTEMLLERITDMDPSVNYDYTADIADQLALKGGFVQAVSPAPQDRRDRSYTIELEVNVHFILERKLEHRRQALAAQGQRNLSRLFSNLVQELDFFRQLSPGAREPLVMDWQNTRRTGVLAVPAVDAAPPPVNPGEAADFQLVLLLPGQTFAEARSWLAGTAPCFGIAAPAEIEDLDTCVQALALVELGEELRADESSQGRRLRQRVQQTLDEQLPKLASVFERAYRHLTLLDPSGEILDQFQNARGENCLELLRHTAERLLESRFPRHYLIAPHQTYYPQAALDEVGQFFQSMSPEAFARMAWGRTVLDGFLLPAGLLKRKGKEYLFAADAADCGPLKMLLDRLADRPDLSSREAFQILAASEYGISELQFKAVLWGALLGGFLVATRSNRKIPLGQLDPARLLEIDGLRPGDTVSTEATAFLNRLDAIPKKLKKSSLSYAECQQRWDLVLRLRGDAERLLSELEQSLNRYREYRAFGLLSLDPLQGSVGKVGQLVKAVRVSAPPVEGLEALARDAGDPGDLSRALAFLSRGHKFFSDGFAAFSFMAGYLQNALAAIPTQPRYQPLSIELDQLWAGFNQLDPTLEDASVAGLQARFDGWQQLYASLYEEEHRLFHQASAESPLRDCLTGPELKLLSRLERLEAFVPETTSAALREELMAAVGTACGRSIWEELQQRPVCACGFQLGQPPQPPPAQPFLDKIGRQLRQAAAQIQHPRFRELLDRFEFHLSRRGEDRLLEATRKFKSAASPEGLLEAAESIDSEFVRRLNAFEPDRKPFEVKHFSDFRERIGRAPKTLRALLADFESWLREGLTDPDQPIRLIDQPARDGPPHGGVLDSLAATAPAEIREDFQRLTEEEFLARCLSARLVTRLALDPEQARPRLPLLPPSDRLSRYAEFADRALEQTGGALLDAVESFESQLGESGYEAVGALPDDPRRLRSLVDGQSAFPRLARWAARRLAKRLSRLDATPEDSIEPASLLLAGRHGDVGDCGLLITAQLWLTGVRRQLDQIHEGRDRRPSLKSLERLFLGDLCLTPWALDALDVLAEHLEFDAVLDASAAASLRDRFGGFLELFETRLKEADPDKLPRTEKTLQEQIPELVERLDASSVHFLYVDALSWPLWKLLGASLAKSMPTHVRLAGERFAYARQPSNTFEQVSIWIESGGPKIERTLQKGFSFGAGREGGLSHKLQWIDEKVHTSRESPFHLHREIVEQLASQLRGILAKLPRNSLLAVFSDHGFVENPAFQPNDKYRQPRYRHGGGSPFELVVPVVFFYSATPGPGG